MKRLFSFAYISQIANWLWRGKFYLLTLGTFLITGLYIFRKLNWFPEHVSAFMAILGLFILFYQQMADARQFSEHKPNTIRNWLKSFPMRKPITLAAGNITLESAFSKAHGKVTLSADDTLENKVEFLLKQVSSIQDNIASIDSRIDNLTDTQKVIEEKFNSELSYYDIAIKKMVAGHIVGDIDKNYFAIVVAFCGTLIQVFT